jgi:hypothetical protein
MHVSLPGTITVPESRKFCTNLNRRNPRSGKWNNAPLDLAPVHGQANTISLPLPRHFNVVTHATE